MVLDLAVLQRFVRAYQDVSPLTIAELWALPVMLRRRCWRSSFDHSMSSTCPSTTNRQVLRPHSLGPGAGVERSIRALRVLDTID